jgi:F0F1-type ATP synthase epsilon subunit
MLHVSIPSDYAAKLDDVDEFSCADSDARAEAELASQRHLEY